MASGGFGSMIEKLKQNPKKIVFTEGTDPRILEAASRLLAGNFLHPVLVGKEDEIQKASEEAGYNIRGAEMYDPEHFDRMDEMVGQFCELRKSKGVTKEQARGAMNVILASIIRNSNSCPIVTKQEKDAFKNMV